MTIKSTKPKKGVVSVGGDSKEEHSDKTKLDSRDEVGGGEIDGHKVENNDIAKRKSYQKMSKSKKLSKSKKMIESSDFLTPRARLAFTKLRQVFAKAPILYYFDPEHYI